MAESNIVITVKAKTDQAVNAMKKLGKAAETNADQLKKVGQGMTMVGGAMTAAITLPIVAAGGALIAMGANLEEAQNLVRESFGDMAGAAEDWANTLSDTLGLNRFELQESAAMLNVMMTSMGMTEEAAFGMSTSMVELAHDMASFYNLPFEEALLKLQSGLTGEAEPLKRLGILVNDATIKTWAWNNGLVAQGETLNEQQKVQARYGAIMEATQRAQGDLARTSSSFTNTMRRMSSQIKETAAKLGQTLIPIIMGVFVPTMERAVKVVMWLSTLFEKSPKPIKLLVIAFFALLAAVGPIVAGLGLMVTAVGAVAGAYATAAPIIATATTVIMGSTLAWVALAAIVGVAAYALTTMILEVTGARGVIESFTDTLMGWREALLKVEEADADVAARALADASKVAGVEVTTLDNALTILLENNKKMQEQFQDTNEEVKTFADNMREAWGVVVVSNQTLQEEMATTRKAAEEKKLLADAAKLLGREAFSLLEAQRAVNIELARTADKIAPMTSKEFRNLAGAARDLDTEQKAAKASAQGMSEQEDMLARASAITGTEIKNLAIATEVLRLIQSNSTMETITATQKAEELLRKKGLLREETKKTTSAVKEGTDGLKGANEAAQDLADTLGGILINGLRNVGSALGDLAVGQGSFASVGQSALNMGADLAATATESIVSGISSLGAMAGPIGAVVGQAAGAIISGIAGLFGQGWKEVGKDIGRDFGVSISEGLMKEIDKLSKDVGDRSTAIQMSLGSVFEEAIAAGGANFDQLMEKAADTFSFLERGQITANEAQTILNDSVSQLLPHLDELGPQGEAQLQRLISAAAAAGIEFEGLDALIQGTFAPDTLEGMMAQFDMTNEQVRALGEKLGIDIQTDLERMAAAVGLSTDEFKELGAAVEKEYGVPMEDMNALLEAMGISAEDLAEALGVEVTGGATDLNPELAENTAELTRGKDQASELARNLERAARASHDIEIPNIPTESAQSGFFSPSLPTDTVIAAHKGERVSITPAGGGGGVSTTMGGGGGGEPITIHQTIVLDGRVVEKKIVRTVNKAKRLGGIDMDAPVDPRA